MKKIWQIPAGLFILLSITVGLGLWRPTDLWLTHALQLIGNHTLDCWVTVFSNLGAPTVSVLMGAFIFALIYRKHRLKAAMVFAGALGGATLIEIMGKLWLPQMPLTSDVYRACVHQVVDLHQIHVDTPNSYPSGHTLRVAFLMATMASLVRSWPYAKVIRATCFTLIALMAITRVYIGDHWASDVAGGLVLAWLAYTWIALPAEKYRA